MYLFSSTISEYLLDITVRTYMNILGVFIKSSDFLLNSRLTDILKRNPYGSLPVKHCSKD
jgi:hypothetical protein